jgi:hypothetical protein
VPVLGRLRGTSPPAAGTGPRTCELAQAVARLNPSAGDLARARQALLTRLDGEADPVMAGEVAAAVYAGSAAELARAVAGLSPAAADLERARQALLALLTRLDGEADPGTTRGLPGSWQTPPPG